MIFDKLNNFYFDIPLNHYNLNRLSEYYTYLQLKKLTTTAMSALNCKRCHIIHVPLHIVAG